MVHAAELEVSTAEGIELMELARRQSRRGFPYRTGLAEESTTGDKRTLQIGESAPEVVIIREELGNMAGHHRDIEGCIGEHRRRPLDPGNLLRFWLGTGFVDRRPGRIHTCDRVTSGCDADREPARAAAEVENTSCRNLVDNREEEIVVPGPKAFRIVDLDQSRVVKLAFSHIGTLASFP